MNILIYDGTFEGLFTAIFEVFEFKYADCEIVVENKNIDFLFGEKQEVVSDVKKSERVLKKILQQTGTEGLSIFVDVFLSEHSEKEKYILSAVRHMVQNPGKNIMNDFSHKEVLKLSQLSRSVHREKHRMLGFVRFEKLQDEVYFSLVEPDFNVLPLIVNHFTDRFRDQKWIIYDKKRQYGYYYDLKDVVQINLQDVNPNTTTITKEWHEEEKNYQRLWQRYFDKTAIEERINSKLHIQHVPKRYWKYLTEKK